MPSKPHARVTEEARRELRTIDRWVSRESGFVRAAELVRSIRRRSDVYAAAPLAGRARPEIAPELRSLLSGSCVVLYRPEATGITVARVIHGSREIEKVWRERDVDAHS
jgi:toxin ParE1/3/4